MARKDQARHKASPGSRLGPAAAFALLLALLGAGWVSWRRTRILITDQELVAWAEARGAKLDGAVIGKRCATCPRGVFASRQLKRGDVILRIPLSLALPTTTQDTPDGRAPVAAEMARDLLIRMHTDPSFNATWGPYWASLPPPDETFGAEMMSRAHLDMLQHPQLVLSAQQRQAEAAQVFDGSYKGGIYPPLASVVGTGVVSLDTFKWVITLFNSRAFGLEAGSFLPLADLLNHASDANVDKLLVKGTFNMVITRAVAKGEELTHDYKSHLIHRPDGALFYYGYVPAFTELLLCVVDLPPGFPAASKTDPAYDDPASGYVTQAEHDRLAAALAAATTTEAEDQVLLDSSVYADWRDQTILHLRILRKRALRQALERVGAALRGGNSRPGGGGGAATAAEL